VDPAAQRALRHLLVHVGFVQEAIERQQLDDARALRKKPRPPLLLAQLAIAARGFDDERQLVPLGGERTDQLAREMENPPLVVRLAERLADDENLHARISSGRDCGSGSAPSPAMLTTRPWSRLMMRVQVRRSSPWSWDAMITIAASCTSLSSLCSAFAE